MGNIYSEIGKNVRELRLQLGLTQEKLAERVHATPSYIVRIEQGTRKPTLDFLARLATSLNVPLPQLLRREAVPRESLLIREINTLLEGQPELVLRLGHRLVSTLVMFMVEEKGVKGLQKAAEGRSSYRVSMTVRGRRRDAGKPRKG